MKARDASLDMVKALAMFLVVFIHVRTHAPAQDAFRTPIGIENFCTVSAIPLFFMMSGFFSKRLFSELSFVRLGLRLVAYLWPVLMFVGVVGIGMRAILGMCPIPTCGLLSYLFSAGWFFLCLALCETVTFFAHFCSKGRFLPCAGLLGLAYALLFALPFGMFHAVEMLPFFWFGVYALPRLLGSCRFVWIGFGSLGLFVFVCFSIGDFRAVGLNFHLTSVNLRTLSGFGFLLLVGRIALGLAGALSLLTLARAGNNFCPALRCFARYGTQTMGIFFVHLLLLMAYFSCGGWFGGGLAGRLGLVVVVFILSHYIVILTKKNHLVDALLWNPLCQHE